MLKSTPAEDVIKYFQSLPFQKLEIKKDYNKYTSYLINAINTRQCKIEFSIKTGGPHRVKISECTPKGGYSIRKRMAVRSIHGNQDFQKAIQEALNFTVQSKEDIKRNKTSAKKKWRQLKELGFQTTDKSFGYRVNVFLYGQGAKTKDIHDPEMSDVMIKIDLWAMKRGSTKYYPKVEVDIEQRILHKNGKILEIANKEEVLEMVEAAIIR